MNWKQWKIGLLIASVVGAFQSFINGQVVEHTTWKQLCIIFATNVGVNVLLYLKQHPIETVLDTTIVTTTTKKEVTHEATNPASDKPASS